MSSGARLAALVRIATGILFVTLGAEKILGGFVRGGFAKSLPTMYKESWPFWRAFLESVVAPRAGAFAWTVAALELVVGLALLLGLWTRSAAFLGAVLMLTILLAQSWVPGAPWDRWLTAGLATRFALLLLVLLGATDSGRVWGIDGRRGRYSARRGSIRR